jgi:hypothetical protein
LKAGQKIKRATAFAIALLRFPGKTRPCRYLYLKRIQDADADVGEGARRLLHFHATRDIAAEVITDAHAVQYIRLATACVFAAGVEVVIAQAAIKIETVGQRQSADCRQRSLVDFITRQAEIPLAQAAITGFDRNVLIETIANKAAVAGPAISLSG